MPAIPIAAAAEGLPLNRARLERIIDLLIALLDAAEPDPDLEPSLGYSPLGVDLEGDTSDDEPSLGWPYGAQTAAGFDRFDLEDGDDNGVADRDGRLEQWPNCYEAAI